MKTHGFYYGTSYYTEIVPQNAKKYFSESFFSRKNEYFYLGPFCSEKYGSRAPHKNTKTIVIELLRFLIQKLLFLLTKINDLCTHLSLGARRRRVDWVTLLCTVSVVV